MLVDAALGERRHRARHLDEARRDLRSLRRRARFELGRESGQARPEGDHHGDARPGGERRIERRLVRLQHRDAAFPLHGLDGAAEGRAGEEDGVGAGLGDIARQHLEAFDHRLVELAAGGGEIGAQRIVEQVGGAGRGPQLGEGGARRLDRDRRRVDEGDAGTRHAQLRSEGVRTMPRAAPSGKPGVPAHNEMRGLPRQG